MYPLLPAPWKFAYGKVRDPPSPSHDSSAESVTPKGNPMTRNNPPNPVPNVPVDPDSDQISSDSYLSDSSESSENKYFKQIRCTKNNKNKCRSKKHFKYPIKNCARFTAKLLTSAYKSNVVKFKLDEYPLQHRVYFLSLVNSLKTIITV